MQILNTDDKTQLIEIKKWFNLQIFKQLDTKYLNGNWSILDLAAKILIKIVSL